MLYLRASLRNVAGSPQLSGLMLSLLSVGVRGAEGFKQIPQMLKISAQNNGVVGGLCQYYVVGTTAR